MCTWRLLSSIANPGNKFKLSKKIWLYSNLITFLLLFTRIWWPVTIDLNCPALHNWDFIQNLFALSKVKSCTRHMIIQSVILVWSQSHSRATHSQAGWHMVYLDCVFPREMHLPICQWYWCRWQMLSGRDRAKVSIMPDSDFPRRFFATVLVQVHWMN